MVLMEDYFIGDIEGLGVILKKFKYFYINGIPFFIYYNSIL